MVRKTSEKEMAAFFAELRNIKIGPTDKEFADNQARIAKAVAATPAVDVGPGTSNTSGGLAYRGSKPVEERLAEITKPTTPKPSALEKYLGKDTVAQLDALAHQPVPTASVLASTIRFTAAPTDDFGMNAFGLSANVALRDDVKPLPYTNIVGLGKIDTRKMAQPKFKERPVKMIRIAHHDHPKKPKTEKTEPARFAYNPRTGEYEFTRSKSANPKMERLYAQLAAKIK